MAYTEIITIGLTASLFFLLYTTAVLVRNLFSFAPISFSGQSSGSELPKVSILIPARNEEAVIARCVRSCLNQRYPSLEIVVLNDQSEDNTGAILHELCSQDNRLRVLNGAGALPGWLGKPRACQQLADAAIGDILMFIDADVWLEPDAVGAMVETFTQDKTDAVTVWPQQHLGSFWEKTALPLVYFTLMTMLPAVYVKRDPRWMPTFIRPYFRTAFAAACGQCIAIKRPAYDAIGGHHTVRNQIVEDVELSKALKRSGHSISMHLGVDMVHCRMYTRDRDMFEGFRKNFFVGFGKSYLFFSAAALLHVLVFLVPYGTLLAGALTGMTQVVILSAVLLLLIHMQRFLVDVRNRWNPFYGVFHAMGVGWFQRLGVTVLADELFGREVRWKGRSITQK